MILRNEISRVAQKGSSVFCLRNVGGIPKRSARKAGLLFLLLNWHFQIDFSAAAYYCHRNFFTRFVSVDGVSE